MKKDKLHNIKSTGFKVPDNYFESFDAKLIERLADKENIDCINSTGYTVPKDYFNTVENSVFDKLNKNEKPVIKLNRVRTLYYIAGIAASIVLLFAIFINVEKPEDSLSVEIVETYLENRDLSSYELAQLLSDANLLEEDFTIATTPYKEENLEDYLLENVDLEIYIE